jgi:predicted NAD/FAD-binding protein
MTVAVVGTGIAGLGAAYALSSAGRAVELFEATDAPGGHVRTVTVGSRAVDTGFIVYNEANYPLLTALFAELGVPTRRTGMSFSCECACGVSWSSRRPWQAGRLLGEILRFLTTADRADVAGKTVDRFLADEGYSESFRWHYLGPMTAALWSTAPGDALAIPAETMLDFFRTHSLLGLRRRRWRTVVGGSRTYVDALLERIDAPLHLETPVRAIRRRDDHVELTAANGHARRFDAVVVATHAPQALALLADPSPDERRVLGAFATTRNETVLHTDDRLLPPRAGSRAAWNYRSPGCGHDPGRPTVTYSLNRLQGLDGEIELLVTLNQTTEIDASAIIRVIDDAHPQMTFAALATRRELPLLNGPRRTAFAGAWQGYGFHEDGLASGLRAADAIREIAP